MITSLFIAQQCCYYVSGVGVGFAVGVVTSSIVFLVVIIIVAVIFKLRKGMDSNNVFLLVPFCSFAPINTHIVLLRS